MTREELLAVQRAIEWSNEPGNAVYTSWDGSVVEALEPRVPPAPGEEVVAALGTPRNPYWSWDESAYASDDGRGWMVPALPPKTSYAFRRLSFLERLARNREKETPRTPYP